MLSPHDSIAAPAEPPKVTSAAPWRRCAWISAAVILLTYIAGVTDRWYFQPDGALYLSLGRNLAEGEGYTLWGEPHIHVPPGYPMFLAAMTRIGLGGIVWLNASVALCGLGALAFAFLALRERLSLPIAMLSMLVVSFGYWMFFYSMTIRSDIPFMLVVWAGIFFWLLGLRRGGIWLGLGTVCLLAGCWLRIVGIPLALSAGFALFLERSRVGRARPWINAALLVAGTAATAAYFWIHHWTVLAGATVPSYNVQLTKMASRSTWDWIAAPFINLYHTSTPLAVLFTAEECKDLGRAILIFWIPIAVGAFIRLRRGDYLLVLAPLGYLGAILLERSLLTRYLIPIAPMLAFSFLIGVQAMFEQASAILSRVRPKWTERTARLPDETPRRKTGIFNALWSTGPRAAIVFTILFLAMSAPDVAKFARRLRQSDYMEKYHLRWNHVIEASDFLREHARPGERYVSSRYERHIAYLSRVYSLPLKNGRFRPAYTEKQFRKWLSSGVNFAVVCRGTYPYYANVLNSTFLSNEGLHLVFKNDSVEIYSVRPIYEAQAKLMLEGKFATEKKLTHTRLKPSEPSHQSLNRWLQSVSTVPSVPGSAYHIFDRDADENIQRNAPKSLPLIFDLEQSAPFTTHLFHWNRDLNDGARAARDKEIQR